MRHIALSKSWGVEQGHARGCGCKLGMQSWVLSRGMQRTAQAWELRWSCAADWCYTSADAKLLFVGSGLSRAGSRQLQAQCSQSRMGSLALQLQAQAIAQCSQSGMGTPGYSWARMRRQSPPGPISHLAGQHCEALRSAAAAAGHACVGHAVSWEYSNSTRALSSGRARASGGAGGGRAGRVEERRGRAQGRAGRPSQQCLGGGPGRLGSRGRWGELGLARAAGPLLGRHLHRLSAIREMGKQSASKALVSWGAPAPACPLTSVLNSSLMLPPPFLLSHLICRGFTVGSGRCVEGHE